MNKKNAIESLSMDLLRVALGYQRNSITMANRFSAEAQKRVEEIKLQETNLYFTRILILIEKTLTNPDHNRVSEDSLMYSTLCKNYVKKYLTT